MINMSPGEQEAGNGHAALEPPLGVGEDVGKKKKNVAKMNLLSRADELRRITSVAFRAGGITRNGAGHGDVTGQNAIFTGCLCIYKGRRCAEVNNAQVRGAAWMSGWGQRCLDPHLPTLLRPRVCAREHKQAYQT